MNQIIISLGGNSFSNVSIPFEGTPEEALEEANRLYNLQNRVKTGLEAKKYDFFIERQLLGESNVLEDYNEMSSEQQQTVQIIKRALKRIKSRE